MAYDLEKEFFMSEKSILDTDFSIFDTETTGDNRNGDDVPIELAVVKWNVKKGVLGKPKSWFINPGEKRVHPSARAVHGIEDKELVGMPTLDKVLPEFENYVGDSPVVAHNIEFDLNMIPSLKDQSNFKLDVLRFARQLLKIGDIRDGHDLRSHKSQELRYWFNLDIDTMGLPAHRAAADILVTAGVFGKLMNLYMESTNDMSLDGLVKYIEAPMFVKQMTFGKLKGIAVEEAIAQEMNSPRNYFKWLLPKVYSGEMNIDKDLLYTIEYHLKALDIDPHVFGGHQEKFGSIKNMASNFRKG